jgi:hypothetical protein
MEGGAMKRLRDKSVIAVLAIGAVLTVFTTYGWAQEKYTWSTKGAEGATTTYPQQLALDVGDVPGHQVRVFEIHWVFPPTWPILNAKGLKIVEAWTHGTSDYINGNGRASGYAVQIYDNGDKIVWRLEGTTQTVVKDGLRSTTYHGVNTITSGTGKLGGIHGLARETCTTPELGKSLKCESEGETWFE